MLTNMHSHQYMPTESSRQGSDKDILLFFTQLLKAQRMWPETKGVSFPCRQQRRSQEGTLNLYLITDLHLNFDSAPPPPPLPPLWSVSIAWTPVLMRRPHGSILAAWKLLWRWLLPYLTLVRATAAANSRGFFSLCERVLRRVCLWWIHVHVCVCHCAHDPMCVHIRSRARSIVPSAVFFSLRLYPKRTKVNLSSLIWPDGRPLGEWLGRDTSRLSFHALSSCLSMHSWHLIIYLFKPVEKNINRVKTDNPFHYRSAVRNI